MHATCTGVMKSRVTENISRNGKLVLRRSAPGTMPAKKKRKKTDKEYGNVLLVNDFHFCLHSSSLSTAWHNRKIATAVARARRADGAEKGADVGRNGRGSSFPASAARRKQTGTPLCPRCPCLLNWPRHR